MIPVLEIQQIAIKNLFSYYSAGEPVRFNIGGSDFEHQRNVAVIAGRNGYGKTSLLNCIRLLLYGASPWVQGVATRGISGVRLTAQSFLLGQANHWDGVFNTIARQEGQKEFFVEMTWLEPAGTVTVRRAWSLSADPAADDVTVVGPAASQFGSDTREALRQRLPPEYAPFYLFDGEDLQRIASAFSDAIELRKSVRQILGIARIDELVAVLAEIARSLPRRARVSAGTAELAEAEEVVRSLQVKVSAIELQEQESRAALAHIDRELTAARDELAALRNRGFGAGNADQVTAEKGVVEKRLADWAERISILVTMSPLLGNPDVVAAAQRLALAAIQRPDAAFARSFEELKKNVSTALSDPPSSVPPLTASQKTFYEARLRNRLEEFPSSAPDQATTWFSDVSAQRLNTLVERLSEYASATELRRTWAQRLQQAQADQNALRLLQARLNETPSGNESARNRFEELIREESRLSTERAALLQLLASLPAERKENGQKLSVARARRQTITTELEERKLLAGRGYLASRLADGFFAEYRDLVEKHYFSALAAATTTHWRDLMESHQMVDRIELDRALGIRFRDGQGADIGAGSLSEGMKQLAATAFLWALADLTQRRFPVIIDTPLGRIDLGHQRRLLKDYLPNAGRQVLVLPTDSELDLQKHSILQPHIYREYYLANPTGRATAALEGSIWSQAPLK